MADAATSACVIADRYLASPAALRSRPLGPVEALDTHSGRAAQVRVVLVPGSWGEQELSEAVSRWCGLGCAEIAGVLDFGRHEDRWYMVVPPSLGMPVERWRSTRRPAPADSARLTLAFGRLVERVAAAGFPPETAQLGDFAVGPGPTPFLERPLLGPPRPGDLPPAPGDGQAVLAAIFHATVAAELPGDLAAWAEQAAEGGFDSLGICLDELERRGSAALDIGALAPTLPGLTGLFDDEPDLEALLPGGHDSHWRRMAGALGILVVLAGAGVALFPGRGPASAPNPPPGGAGPLPVATSQPDPAAAPRSSAQPPRVRPRPAARVPRPPLRAAARSGPARPPAPATAPVQSQTTSGSTSGSLLPPPAEVTVLPVP